MQLYLEGAAISGTGSVKVNYDAFIQWDVHIIAIDGAGSTNTRMVASFSAAGDGATNQTVVAAEATDTVDWAADVAVTFQVTGGGGTTTGSLKSVTIEALGAK
jgi:hypothetical protein